MVLVAGVDSSTRSCKVVVCEATSGEVMRSGSAPHPEGTQVHPDVWWDALQAAVHESGGLEDVSAVAVAGQQHGMVCLDAGGDVVRPAMLWNDLQAADAAEDLIAEFGGRSAWADAVGTVPVAALTVSKLRWLARHEPAHAARVAAVCLPHDYLTWRLSGGSLDALVTDRGDASGTGYFSAASGEYRYDLLRLAFGSEPVLPRVLGPSQRAGVTAGGLILGAGTGDNMAAALGVSAERGDVIVSVGTLGVATAVTDKPVCDESGAVAGFADATGGFLPLACTLNAARVLEAFGRLLGIGHIRLADLALSASPGAGGVTLVPYLDGERTPNRPTATGTVLGLRRGNATPANLARAAVEGMLCGLADAVDALRWQGVEQQRMILVGGGSGSSAVCRIAPTVFGGPVLVPEPREYVAIGAARQAAWALLDTDMPPSWGRGNVQTYGGVETTDLRARYTRARDLVLERG